MGRLSSPDLDGPVFAHFSAVADQSGYRELRVGQRVTFGWETAEQDGCRFRAVEVRAESADATRTEPDHSEQAPAYRSALTIEFDQE